MSQKSTGQRTMELSEENAELRELLELALEKWVRPKGGKDAFVRIRNKVATWNADWVPKPAAKPAEVSAVTSEEEAESDEETS